MNTSMVGDSIQLGFHLSDEQMRDPLVNTANFVLQSIVIEIEPGRIL